MASRNRNAAVTREGLLASARRRFQEESYDNVSLREVARDAGVDVALVGRYFGSKQELFREVLRSSRGEWLDPAVSPQELPCWLAALATQDQPSEDIENLERLLTILRSASSPEAAEVVRESFRENVLGPITTLLDGREPEMRAGLAVSLLIGITVLRTIMQVEPLRRPGNDALRARLAELLNAALADRGPL